MRKLTIIFLLGVVITGCNVDSTQEKSANEPNSKNGANDKQAVVPDEQQEAEIRRLIEQLVLSAEPAGNQPIINPNMKIVDADGNATPISGVSDAAEKHRQKFNACQEAFNQLGALKGLAIPILVEHLDDKRQSINFRNHRLGNSVGDACYWNIYFQLVDQPDDYSEYGYSRQGRDGENHPKPYWEGTPFDDGGGMRAWLSENKELNYREMQIKCLQWLLDKETEIGASDADSYFLNILPLEIQILERRAENGEEVNDERARLKKIRDGRLADQIPKELLPDGRP